MLHQPLPPLSWRLAAAVLLGLFLPLSASAQVYKCTDSSGKTAYQSQPCPEATQGGQLDLRWTSSALPTLSSSASLSGNVTVSEMRQAIISSCATNVAAKGDATLRRIASTQPAKFRSFCDCVADVSTSDVERLKNMAQRGDRAGLEQLGLRAGLSCASRLQ